MTSDDYIEIQSKYKIEHFSDVKWVLYQIGDLPNLLLASEEFW